MTTVGEAKPIGDDQNLRTDIEAIANQLCQAVKGDFQMVVRVDTRDESIQKLKMLVNFVLDTARRALSEAREQNDELTELNSRLRAVLDGAADGIVTMNSSGIIESFNPAAEQMFDYEANEVLDKNVNVLMSAPYREQHDGYLQAYLDTGRGKIIGSIRETIGRRKDGSTFPIDLRVGVASCNKERHFIGIISDTTERKYAQEALRQAKEYTDNIIKSMIDMLIVVAPDGKIMSVNEATVKLLGYSEEELTGQPARILFSSVAATDEETTKEEPEEETQCLVFENTFPFQQVLLRRLASQGFVNDVEAIYLTKDRGEMPVLFSGSVMRDGNGAVRGFVCIVQDITHRKRAEAERSNLEIQLRHAQKLESVGQVAAGIAHEINTPTQYVGDNTRFLQDAFVDLAPILGKAQTLADAVRSGSEAIGLADDLTAVLQEADVDYLIEEIPNAIEQSLDGIDRVTRIVRAMKEFSHPGTEGKTSVDLNQAIKSTVTVATNEWKYVADMEMELDPNLPEVPCLPGEINQVILNIVINAAHAIASVVSDGGEAKGVIKVSTQQDGDWVEIRIADTGTGIPEEARDKIFDPFFTTKEVGKGTGQGLSIAHGVIVNRHGGMIDFETEHGKGSTFVIRLPLVQETTASEKVVT